MYLIIDEEYKIYKTKELTLFLISKGRAGKISIVNLKTMQGMNMLENHQELGEWSSIQDLPEEFLKPKCPKHETGGGPCYCHPWLDIP